MNGKFRDSQNVTDEKMHVVNNANKQCIKNRREKKIITENTITT